MRSINDKALLNEMLLDSQLLSILNKSENSDIFRKEVMNFELDYKYRIRRFYLNSLYFKLIALKHNNDVILKKII